MNNRLDILVSQLQNQFRSINAEAEAWKAQNEEKLKNTISLKTQETSAPLKALKAELLDLESKQSTIKKYYTAYFGEASPSVQKSTYCQPVPVNMTLYKNQLANSNAKQAADNIVNMARGNLKYLEIQIDELKEKIHALEGAGNQAKEELNLLDEQLRIQYEKRYLDVLMSEDVLQLKEEINNAGSAFMEADWERFSYVSPQEKGRSIMLGNALYDMPLPKYMHEHARIPEFWKDGRAEVPVCVPLDHFHLIVNYHVNQSMITKEGIRTIIGNLLKQMPAGSVRVYPIDLETFNGASFGGLVHLSGPAPAFMAPVPSNENQLLKTLKEIYDDAVKASQKMTGYRTLEEYNAEAADGEKLSRKVIIAYGCPERLSSMALEHLERIYHMSVQCGISIIAVHNSNTDIGSSRAKSFYQNLASTGLVIDCNPEGQFVTEECAPFRWLRGLHAFSEETVDAVRDAYGAAKPVSAGDSQSIEDCFKNINHKRGNRRLSLAFGVDEENRIKKFDFEEMNFAAYISGSAGCGKSSLMHSLIAGILLNYHPEDIELWLVDFKMTEFQLYAKNMPPHVKRVILESSEEVVLDLIDELTDVLEKRTKLFSKYGLKDLIRLPEEFRMKHLPLIIVMVDEFATMTQIIRNAPTSGNLTYAEKLENLLAKGRALGFRFIFADQAYEAGVQGLTPKAKNQIGQRFAMANVSQDEMRGTLALPSAELTDEVRHWMSTLPPFHALTSEKEAVEGTLENVIRVHRSRVAFVPTERIVEITKKLNEMYHPVASAKELTDDSFINKNPLVVDGQRVYTFKESNREIQAWDAAQDYPQEIQRLYLGRPCALRKQAPVELKPAPGENLLMIVETPDMAASAVLSAIASAEMQNKKITVLADPMDPFYRKYRRRWEMYDCLTDMEDICAKIAELRQRVESNGYHNDLIICLGIYNMHQLWEEYPKKKKDFSFNVPVAQDVKPVKTGGAPSPLVSLLGDKLNNAASMTAAAEEDDDFMAPLKFSTGFDEADEWEKNEPSVFADREDQLYNAIEDIRFLFTKGPSRGCHFAAVMSQYSEYRELKLQEKMFRHLIYENLAKEELADVIGFGRYARIPNGALRYVSKKDAFSLRPYLWPGLIINGWTMDEEGLAVEAGDEDDEFI